VAKVAVATFELGALGSGGVGTFTLNWAKLLRDAGEDVTVVLGAMWQTAPVSSAVRDFLKENGIGLLVFNPPVPSKRRTPFLPALDLSEQIADAIEGFDAAYFADTTGQAMIPLRRARLPGARMPICVTVMHGPTKWVRRSNRYWQPERFSPDLEFQDRYVLENSHWVAAPSAYMFEWARREGWKLPARQRVLGLPFRPLEDSGHERAEPSNEPLRHLIYFGRLEERKGFALFTEALHGLQKRDPEAASRVAKVTLLGSMDLTKPQRAVEAISSLRQCGWKVEHIRNLDSAGARAFLRGNASDGLAIMPSLPDGDNFPFTVLESTLAGGIRVIASRIGGIPEILGPDGSHALFEPKPEALAAKIAECLRSPEAARVRPYDWRAANERWLRFHQEVMPARPSTTVAPPRSPDTRVDVYVTCRGQAPPLEQTLESLASQTCRDFTVTAAKDGSTADAPRGTGKYLLLLDAGDTLPLHGMERLLECIEATGDDCLVPASREAGDPEAGKVMPLGPALVAALRNPWILGGSAAIVRRTAFEAVGGFRGRELIVRLSLQGFRVEVIPEYLHLHWKAGDAPPLRLLEAYEEALHPLGLSGMADLLWAHVNASQSQAGMNSSKVPAALRPLQAIYRKALPEELRLRLHELLLKPFFGERR
jgi:glycosyltransferase involved in cell wall biosynthesis